MIINKFSRSLNYNEIIILLFIIAILTRFIPHSLRKTVFAMKIISYIIFLLT